MPRPFRLLFCVIVGVTGLTLFGHEDTIQFTDETIAAGLRAPLDGLMGHAAAWGDVDGDGDLDLYAGGFSDRPNKEYSPAPGPVANRLFRNLSAGRFEPMASPTVEIYGRTSGALFVDLDNDGWVDLYVANNARASSGLPAGVQHDAQVRTSALFRNENGTFVDVTSGASCVTAVGTARTAGVFDYDADGLLDLLVVEDRFGRNPHSRLCRNEGGFRFTDVTAVAGLPGDLFGFGLAVADLNEDGRADIFVTHSNRLFMSTAGGRYVEPPASRDALAWRPLDAEDWPAGAAFGDLNRDGRLDLVVGIHHERARNRVYLNEGIQRGAPVFRDVSADAGLPSQLSTKSPHVEVQDFDNDGWPDLYFSAAWSDADGRITPLVFRNLGAQNGIPRFAPLRPLAQEKPRVYFPAGPSGDYDADGRVDLFLVNWFQGNYSRLLKNESKAAAWLDVSVSGRKTNRMGIGSKVRVYKAGQGNENTGLLGFQEIGTGYGFASGQAPIAHFGLGDQGRVDVEVVFPDGTRTARRDVAGSQRLTIEEP